MKTLQDLLNLWIERGAKYKWETVWDVAATHEEYLLVDVFWSYKKSMTYAVLFSPESNFFEVMKRTDQWVERYAIDKNYWARCTSRFLEKSEYHKIMAVLSPDPIQYCIDNIQRPE